MAQMAVGPTSLAPGNKNENGLCKIEDQKNVEESEQSSFRLKIENFPHFFTINQVKKFLQSTLGEIPFRKVKTTRDVTYVSLTNENDAVKAMEFLDNYSIKQNRTLRVVRTSEESRTRVHAKVAASTSCLVMKTAKELVTPLADVPYNLQLERKFEDSKRVLENLRKQLLQAQVKSAQNLRSVLSPIIRSPTVTGYRNKCEFSIGYGMPNNGESPEIFVGFVCGKMADFKCAVVSAPDCQNLSVNTSNIVKEFETFVREFGEEPFDEFKRTGFWKLLAVRDFLGDCMIIVTVSPHPDQEVITRVKKELVERFLSSVSPSEVNKPFNFRVTSIYLVIQENTGDERAYEHLAGTPYIYETLLGVRFRISPSTFFQTNTRGAALLYSEIGDKLGLPKFEKKISKTVSELLVDDEKKNGNLEVSDALNSEGNLSSEVDGNKGLELVEAKRIKLDNENGNRVSNSDPISAEYSSLAVILQPLVILDICCGAGSIGLCMLRRIQDCVKCGAFPTSVPYGCVGIEIIAEAVRDARKNAADNGFDEKSCVFITGQAEKIFNELVYHMPNGCPFSGSKIVGVLDPPRAGVSDKVIIGCRSLEQMKCLVYVSCDPKSAIKNLLDLCRPTSKKYSGMPFQITSIQPIDLFPQTEHCEWVIQLTR